MLIPTKFSGYQAGIRLYPGGGGGGGGGGGSDAADDGTTPGIVATIGEIGNAAAVANGGPSDYYSPTAVSNTTTANRPMSFGPVREAGLNPRSGNMNAVGGRLPPGADQFYQPVYQPQYNNYANPLLFSSVSSYGTNPGPSQGFLSAVSEGGQGLDNYYASLREFGRQQGAQPFGMNYATFNPARRALGANMADLQAAYSYNPFMETQFTPFSYNPAAQFNPYAGSFQTPFSYGRFDGGFMEQPSRIVSRSAQVRGRPNVMMRRAEGGIVDLLSKK